MPPFVTSDNEACISESIICESNFVLPKGGIVDQHVCHRSHQLTVLNDWRAAQVCDQERTTKFVSFFIVSTAIFISSSVGKRFGSVSGMFNALYFEPA